MIELIVGVVGVFPPAISLRLSRLHDRRICSSRQSASDIVHSWHGPSGVKTRAVPWICSIAPSNHGLLSGHEREQCFARDGSFTDSAAPVSPLPPGSVAEPSERRPPQDGRPPGPLAADPTSLMSSMSDMAT